MDAGTGSPTLLAYHIVPGVPPVTRVNSERGSMSISSAVVGHPNAMVKNEVRKKTASYIAKRKEVRLHSIVDNNTLFKYIYMHIYLFEKV